VVLRLGLLFFSFVSKHNTWSSYDWVYCCCHLSVNTICGGIMVGLIVGFVVSKHNIWSSYDWVYCCCRSSVNTRCSRIMIGLSSVSKHNIWLVVLWLGLPSLSSVRKHNMWSYYGLVCRCCRPSINTIRGSIMDWFVIVFVSQ
jgi:hypothetical protein